jgi:hypothetical protein
MAEWIKLHEKIIRDPVVMDQAEQLNLDPRIVAWSWVTLWNWARETTGTGFVGRITPARIDGVVGIAGFAKHAGEWLVFRDGGVEFPHWDRHNSEGAKERAMTARRNKRHRQNKKNDERDGGSVTNVTVERHERDGDTVSRVTVQASPEEKRREENREIPPLHPVTTTVRQQPSAAAFRAIDTTFSRMFPSTVGTPSQRSARVTADIAQFVEDWQGKVPSFDDWLTKALAHVEKAGPTKWVGALGLLRTLAGEKVDSGLDPGETRPLNNVPLRVTNAKCDDAAVDAAVAEVFKEKPRRAAY